MQDVFFQQNIATFCEIKNWKNKSTLCGWTLFLIDHIFCFISHVLENGTITRATYIVLCVSFTYIC
jgi:hypothetical protein